MIIPVTSEHETVWAEMCVALWPDDSLDEWIQDGRDDGFENQFLYMIDAAAAAFISLSLRHDYVEGTSTNPVGYLEAIYVKPEFQNRGIARKLVNFAKQWAVKHGCQELASDCELDNDVSRKFHNKVGFEEANTIVCFTMELY